MSKSVNYLDLIKNPEKNGLVGQKNVPAPAQPRSNGFPKEAVIPTNLLGAKKNEWEEQRSLLNSSNRSNASNKQSSRQSSNVSASASAVAPSVSSNSQLKNAEKAGGSERDSKVKSNQAQAEQLSNNSGVSKRQQVEKSEKEVQKKQVVVEPMSKQERLRAQYSLKEESKQDYKRIFQQVVKEYRNDENFFFDANQTRGSTYFLCVLVVVFSAMIFFDYKAMVTPRFCANDDGNLTAGAATTSGSASSDCWECPANADCKRNVMRCKEGFIQTQMYTCELNPKLITNSENFIIEKLIAMQSELGDHACFSDSSNNNSDTPSSNNNNNNNEKEVFSIKFNELIKEAISRIKDDTSINEQEMILERFLTNKSNQLTHGFTYNTEGKTLETRTVRLTMFCQVKLFVNANKTACKALGVAILILSIVARIIMHRIRQESIAKKIYEELEKEIQASPDNSINVSYYKEGIVNKYKSEFNERIWMLVDQRRFDEKKINVFRDYDGLYWSQA